MTTKSKSSRTAFAWLFIVAALLFVLALPFAVHADTVPTSAPIELATHVLPDGSLLLAQIAAPASAAQVSGLSPQVSPPAATPFYASETFWSALFALAGTVFGIWRNAKLSTHQKITSALIEGIEAASKLPEVAAYEGKVKQTIQDSAREWGIQPVLHAIVQEVTEPAATSNGSPV